MPRPKNSNPKSKSNLAIPSIHISAGATGSEAIYLMWDRPDGTGHGYRLFGSKCYGTINTLKRFKLDVGTLDDAIKELKHARRTLRQRDR